MKTRFIFACAAAGIVLTAFGGTTASANEDYGTLEISPNVVRAGAEVTLSGTCKAPEFTPQANVGAPALDATLLTGTKGPDGVWQLSATATVMDVGPGQWSATFTCGEHLVSGEFTIEKSPEPPVVKPEISVDPKKGVPGAKAEILLLCGDETSVTSKALKIGKLEPLPKKDGDEHPWLRAIGTVQDVKPGDYPIVMNCGGKEFPTNFTALAKGAPAPNPKAQVPVKPKGAADTGSLDAAPAPADDTNLYVLGGAALAALGAAGGLGAAVYRKRQRV